MSKHNWHVARENEKPKVVRDYRWITKMFEFVLRNPAMFRNRNLVIYDWNKEVVCMTFEDIKEISNKGLKEGETRKIIKQMGVKK